MASVQAPLADTILTIPASNQDQHDDQILPTSACLNFPPFPVIPPNKQVTPYNQWKPFGVWVATENASQKERDSSEMGPDDAQLLHHSCRQSHDTHGTPLAELDSSPPEVDVKTLEARAKAKRSRRLAKSKLGARMEKEDCWKIGEQGVFWEEPDGTSKSNFDVSIPPFTRLISATNDFYQSRLEEFQSTRSKRLFDLLRNAFGLRIEFSGSHWPGSGPGGVPYQHRQWRPKARRFARASHRVVAPDASGHTVEETCILLTRMEKTVRGFLASVRREAEAGWDFEPALQLSRITSAFMSFIRHYDVLSESELQSIVETTTALARKASQQILDAKKLEEVLANSRGWNRAAWSVWGGSYSGPERGGLEKETQGWGADLGQISDELEFKDDGGWVVEAVVDTRPEAMTAEQARPHLSALIEPMAAKEVSLLDYIPFARRSISSILPPFGPKPGQPAYASKLHRIVTVPAPWTPEEKWRVHRPRFDDEGSDDEEDGDDDHEIDVGALDKEEALVQEPSDLVIWFEREALGDESDLNKLIGMGLRGRWATMGKAGGTDEERWWSFKPKDFVLPAFWQSGVNEHGFLDAGSVGSGQ